MQRRAGVRSELETLFPGYFAVMMASGIVSNALWMNHFIRLSQSLYFVSFGVYAKPQRR
ncbi:MAG: hypothetical protein K6T31_04360 [Alicyclobacillus sp.]|nr:hypothetical protein [Alicyclobacillus sp.]